MRDLARAVGRAFVSTCRDFWHGNPPSPPAPGPLVARFVCYQYHDVHVAWTRRVETPSPIERAIGGIEPGQVVDQCHHLLWPHERFTRDDIDHHDVQQGYQSHRIGPIWRRYLPVDGCALVYGRDVVRVTSTGPVPDGFFVGFACDLLTAMTWVATGRGALFVPWSTAP